MIRQLRETIGIALVALGLCWFIPPAAYASWPTDPTTSLPVGVGSQPVMVTDGSGGTIIAWVKEADPLGTVYCQHVLASGAIDPQWPADGKQVCGTNTGQTAVVITSDAAGGAILAWSDGRPGCGVSECWSTVVLQHVLSSGQIDPRWPADGLESGIVGDMRPLITSGGDGSAIFAARAYYDSLRTFRMLASGRFDPAWPRAGVALPEADRTELVALITDDSGGAIGVTNRWADDSSNDLDLFAHHVLTSGRLDPTWPEGGSPICVAPRYQDGAVTTADGRGGIFVAWNDQRPDAEGVYVHHVTLAGVDPSWPPNGLRLAKLGGSPAIASDDVGGAFVSWQSLGGGVYAQHVLRRGIVDATWPEDGVPIALHPTTGRPLALRSDGAAGAVLVWDEFHQDGRGDIDEDLFAQHLLRSGKIDPRWPEDGLAIATAPGIRSPYGSETAYFQNSVMIPSGTDGWILALFQDRFVGTNNFHIGAQRFTRSGHLGSSPVPRAKNDVTTAAPPLLAAITPNPVRHTCSIAFDLPAPGPVQSRVFDLHGRLAATLADGLMPAGPHVISWERKGLADGIYFVTIQAGGLHAVQRLVLIR